MIGPFVFLQNMIVNRCHTGVNGRSHEGVTGGLGLATKDVFWQSVPKCSACYFYTEKKLLLS